MQISIKRSVFEPGETRVHCVLLDLFLIALIAYLVGAICFSRTYFGDELAPLGLAYYYRDSFWKTFFALCQYKPRIIFNLIWSAIAVNDAPRVVPMVINTLAFVAIAWIVYYWAAMRYQASRWVAWISVLAVLFCRFGMVLYFDYIAGIVETLALALFMGGILMGTRRKMPLFKVGPLRRTLSVVLIIFAVFVYEPFIASAVALAVVAILDTLDSKDSRMRRAIEFIYPLMVGILPLLLFYLATKWLATLSLLTGTDARYIALSTGNLEVFGLYLLNVFLGTNFGHPWLVGGLTLSARGALPLFVVSALVLASSYIYAIRDAWAKCRLQFVASLKWLLLVVAVVAVSSLPGTFRPEGRWIFPAFVFLILMFLAAFRGRSRLLLLCIFLVLDTAYLAAGSELAIYNVYSVRTASRIANSINTIHPIGHQVAIIGLDSPWLIVGNQFDTVLIGNDTFGRVNLGGTYQIHPVSVDGNNHYGYFDFGLIFNYRTPIISPQFDLVNGSIVNLLLNPPSEIRPAGCNLVGGFGKWSGWKLHGPNMLQSSGELLIRPGADGFRSLPVATLQGHVLAYMAHSQTGQPQPMRLQINWHGINDVFLDASISVVEVGAQDKVYTTYVSPPAGADSGLVYVTTQEGATGGIVIDAVCLY